MFERSLDMIGALDAVDRLARTFVAHESALPGPSLRDPARLVETLHLALGEEGLDAEEVLGRMGGVLEATPSSSSWRFLNQLFGGREPIAVAAEMLTALPNISLYTYKAAGAQVLVEREVLGRMLAKVGFDDGEGCFTPGGSMANLVAMLLARNEIAPDSRDHGLGAQRLTIYTSAEGHYSIPKNAGILGIGRHNVRRIPTMPDGRMDVRALARQLSHDRTEGLRPCLVNATAGTTVRGAFDPIRTVAEVCREHDVWLHVDGALGGSLLLSSAHRHLVDGAELADSYSWDPHKMMGVPLQASVLLVARPGTLVRSLDETADYLFQADADDLNPGHRSLLCGRRSDAFKLWAAWLHLGDRGWDARLDRQMSLARLAAERIDADPDLALCEWPPSINVCFEVRGHSSVDVCDRLEQECRLKIGHGDVAGRRAIRLVCVNPDLDEDDLRAILAEIKAAARTNARCSNGSSAG